MGVREEAVAGEVEAGVVGEWKGEEGGGKVIECCEFERIGVMKVLCSGYPDGFYMCGGSGERGLCLRSGRH